MGYITKSCIKAGENVLGMRGNRTKHDDEILAELSQKQKQLKNEHEGGREGGSEGGWEGGRERGGGREGGRRGWGGSDDAWLGEIVSGGMEG